MSEPVTGFKLQPGGSELQVQFKGDERIAVDGTGIGFNGAAPVAQASNIATVTVTGTYANDDDALETAINSIIAVLINNGFVAAAP